MRYLLRFSVLCLALSACSTTRVLPTLESCQTDPVNVALQCTKVDETTYTKDFNDAFGMTCFPTDALLDYVRACK